ncbi:MAG: hemerythrin domain-containing protein, partial [Nocardioidaceae bacterium]
PHTHVEEQVLLPAMETDFPEQVARLRAEHRVIEEVVQEVAEGWAPRGWEKRLGAAMTVLRLHIHHEQDGVFPAALSTLGVADWERLERVRAQVGTALEAGATA